MNNVNYSKSGFAPDEYACSYCSRKQVKLWREYNTFSPIILFCVVCACMREKVDIESVNVDGTRFNSIGNITDQIGNLVPAVPNQEGVGYWGYTSVPDNGVAWWKSLKLKGDENDK